MWSDGLHASSLGERVSMSVEQDCPSGAALRRGFLVVVSGPSAAGKNTLLNAVLPRLPKARYSVSATTRPPRPGEVHGRDYFFLTEEEFDQKVARGEFLEWATFVGYRYGTPRAFVERCLEEGSIVLMDIDIQGAAQVKARMPEAILVFVLPPSFKVLQERIVARGKDSPEAIARRMAEVHHELARLPEYDYVVFNHNLDDAVAALQSIIWAECCRAARYDTARLIAQFMEDAPSSGGVSHGPAVSRRTSAKG